MSNQLNENQTRDLGTLLQITGRLVEHFLGENFLKFHDESQSILRLLLGLSNQLVGSIETFGDAELELFAQCLSCLRPFQHWLRFVLKLISRILIEPTTLFKSTFTKSLLVNTIPIAKPKPYHNKILSIYQTKQHRFP